ncbi:MAG: DUF721 domain-containing protein [Thermoleophilia bacterium]|nr:DUF721 domain-containing protein [Thermoleophilia bacterium]
MGTPLHPPVRPPEDTPAESDHPPTTHPGTSAVNDFACLGDVLASAAAVHASAAALHGAMGDATGDGAAAGSSAQDSAHHAASRLVAFLWPEVVGPEIAANARPAYLRNGRLVVVTASPAWAQSLHLLAEHLLSRLRERLAQARVSVEINKVVFRHAGWEDTAVQPDPVTESALAQSDVQLPTQGAAKESEPSGSLSLEEQRALAEVEQMPLPPGLKEALLRAMKASFVRGKKDFVR